MLRFWASKLHFWRKSRRNASFWSLKASFLKEVSQKSFVLELQRFNFEGSLAEKLRFGASKIQFWRKSRRKASFLIFKASFLKEVSQKCFVFELQSFKFEGSLAEKFRFWSSKLRFWRKSRRNASFLSFKASILKEVSQKSFVFDLQSFVFEGSLAEMLRFWASKLQFWRKSRTKADNQNHLNLNSFESDINWLSNQLNSAHSLPIGSLSLETSATALCGRYVIPIYLALHVRLLIKSHRAWSTTVSLFPSNPQVCKKKNTFPQTKQTIKIRKFSLFFHCCCCCCCCCCCGAAGPCHKL